jgi:tRNA wybutosine-synthesizing protein 4
VLQHAETVEWLVTRFGATCLPLGDNEYILLGGISADSLLGFQDEAVCFSVSSGGISITRRFRLSSSQGESEIPRPLLVGHSAVILSDMGSIVVAGGGATCFSMGAFWNKGVYDIQFRDTLEVDEGSGRSLSDAPQWVHRKTIDIGPGQTHRNHLSSGPISILRTRPVEDGRLAQITPIPRVRLETENDFERILREGRPVVIEGLDLGSCVSAWTLEYMVEKVGAARKVGVPLWHKRLNTCHRADQEHTGCHP